MKKCGTKFEVREWKEKTGLGLCFVGGKGDPRVPNTLEQAGDSPAGNEWTLSTTVDAWLWS